MKLSLIAAMDKNNVIGCDNEIPWNIPSDLKRFKEITLNKPVIMGRTTYESIGKPLSQRENIVLTENENFKDQNVHIVNSINDAVNLSRLLRLKHSYDEIIVIGGQKIYEQFLPIANRIYQTVVLDEFYGDTYFPNFSHEKWKIIESDSDIKEEKDSHKYHFFVWERK